MIAVVQRVSSASVTVAEPVHEARIDSGLCVLLGIVNGDRAADGEAMARKIAQLRVFRDEQGKMNRSLLDTGGSVLLVSQFTLAGDCNKGLRPSFVAAAPPEEAEKLVRQVGSYLREDHGILVQEGVFGAMMEVTIVNDGPVTLILERP